MRERKTSVKPDNTGFLCERYGSTKKKKKKDVYSRRYNGSDQNLRIRVRQTGGTGGCHDINFRTRWDGRESTKVNIVNLKTIVCVQFLVFLQEKLYLCTNKISSKILLGTLYIFYTNKIYTIVNLSELRNEERS